MKQKSRVGFTSCSLADSHLSLLQNYSGFGSTLWPFATISHLLHLWPLIFLERMLRWLHTHPQPPWSLWARLCLCHWNLEGLDPQAFISPGLHRALPHCSFQTLRRCLTNMMRFYFTQSKTTDIKWESLFLSFSSWRGWFFSCLVIQLLFFFSIMNYISWLTNKSPIGSGN